MLIDMHMNDVLLLAVIAEQKADELDDGKLKQGILRITARLNTAVEDTLHANQSVSNTG